MAFGIAAQTAAIASVHAENGRERLLQRNDDERPEAFDQVRFRLTDAGEDALR